MKSEPVNEWVVTELARVLEVESGENIVSERVREESGDKDRMER